MSLSSFRRETLCMVPAKVSKSGTFYVRRSSLILVLPLFLIIDSNKYVPKLKMGVPAVVPAEAAGYI